MLCEVCKENDVVITVTEIDGNGVRQVRLCEQCAAERGLQASVATPPAAIGDFLHEVQQHISPSQTDAVRCSFCSSTLRDFRQTGRLGCPYCYTAFEQSLRDLLKKVHGQAQHKGREYAAALGAIDAPQPASPDRLRERLERAIRNEEFELAASLRDQLRAIE
ncbi:MAG: UvrB/UvrC motif-containing protein [Gemmatimonadaceae bacterium]